MAAAGGAGFTSAPARSGSGKVETVASRTPKIDIVKLRDDKAKFVLSGTDISVANALRRVLMAEVPTFAITDVFIVDNSSAAHDEMVAHRLGLIPLRWKPKDKLPNDYYQFSDECDCDFTYDVCPKCSIELTLDVYHNVEPGADSRPVTSRDLKFVRKEDEERWEVAHFATQAEQDLCSHDPGIVINKLGVQQRLSVVCVAKMGIGKMHAKFNPTATVSMRYQPDIRLNYDLLDRISAANKRDFVKRCTPGVFRYDEASGQIIVAEAKRANNIDEIRKLGLQIARASGSSDSIVSVSFVPEVYVFTVESCGALLPAQIIQSALRTLVAKLSMMSLEAAKLAGGGAMAMAGVGMGTGASGGAGGGMGMLVGGGGAAGSGMRY